MSLPFPNVPFFPGVPDLPRLPGRANIPLTLGIDALASLLWQATFAPPQWGVFNSSGNLVIAPDSVVDFEARSEWQVSSFPVQKGAFASYNKVIVPPEYVTKADLQRSTGRKETAVVRKAAWHLRINDHCDP